MAGDIVHFELYTRNAERAKKFYSTVFGWNFKDSEIPGLEYYLIDGPKPGGGLNPQQDKPGVVVYMGTDDIDATIKKIREQGGKADEKAPIPGQGWFAGCTDLEGNPFALFQSDESVTAEQMQQYQETRA